MEGHHGRVGGGDHLPGGEALQQGGHPQGLQGSDAGREGHPQAIRGEGSAGAIEGSNGGPIVGRDQGEGLGAGQQPAQPQAIPQPVAVGVDQGLRGRGPLQPPGRGQAVAIEGGPFGGLQLPAAAGQFGGLLIAQGRGVDQGLILSSLGGLSDRPQVGRGLGASSRAGLRAGGLQLPSLGLQQAGDRCPVREALPVAVGAQLGPGLQPGTLSVSPLQHPQQRISDGPKVADQVGRIGGARAHPQGSTGAALGGEQVRGHLGAPHTGGGLADVLRRDPATSKGDHRGGPPAGEAHP